MKPPTREEIDVYHSLDGMTAWKHFRNKTLDQAEALFRENGLRYCQDLMWMGPKAFNFYLQAAYRYVQSGYSEGDSDMINCLSSVIEYRLNEKESSIAAERVLQLIEYVIDNYGKFEADVAIYGDLLAKYRQLREKVKATI